MLCMMTGNARNHVWFLQRRGYYPHLGLVFLLCFTYTNTFTLHYK